MPAVMNQELSARRSQFRILLLLLSAVREPMLLSSVLRFRCLQLLLPAICVILIRQWLLYLILLLRDAPAAIPELSPGRQWMPAAMSQQLSARRSQLLTLLLLLSAVRE